jgi:hypothetical protein
VRLFKRRQQSDPQPCPRCSQLVPAEGGSLCPMCGWDLHEAYQGPTTGTDDAGELAHVRAERWGGGA